MPQTPKCPVCAGDLEVTSERATCEGTVMADGRTGWCPSCETWTPEHEWRKSDFEDGVWLRAIAAANKKGEGFTGWAGPDRAIRMTNEIVERLLDAGLVRGDDSGALWLTDRVEQDPPDEQ